MFKVLEVSSSGRFNKPQEGTSSFKKVQERSRRFQMVLLGSTSLMKVQAGYEGSRRLTQLQETLTWSMKVLISKF